jgi:hypothetical protein
MVSNTWKLNVLVVQVYFDIMSAELWMSTYEGIENNREGCHNMDHLSGMSVDDNEDGCKNYRFYIQPPSTTTVYQHKITNKN